MRRAVIVAFALVVVGIISVALKEGRWNRLSDAEKAAAIVSDHNEWILEGCREQFREKMESELRDPGSLELIDEVVETRGAEGVVFLKSVTFKYRAANGFRGMALAEYKVRIPVSQYAVE